MSPVRYLRFILCCCALVGAGVNAADTYSFSVVPQYNVVQLHAEWAPVLERVSQETGIKLELVLASTIPKFERGLLKGEPDFAFVNPYHAVMAKKAQGYSPLFKDAKPLTGILLVRRDSPYQKIEDLSEKDVGFPAPNAFGASLYMRAIFAEKNIKFQPQLLNTHGNVFRSIVNGTVAAGGAVNNTFNDEQAAIKDQLRVLYQTPGAASHPVVSHPRVPEKVALTVTAAFFALQKDASGMAMLKDIRLPKPVVANYASDFLPLEKLGIEKFVIIEKE